MTDNILKPITVLNFADILQDNGYKAKILKKGDYLIISSGANGHSFTVYFFNNYPEEVDQVCLSFQLETCWKGVPRSEYNRLSKLCNNFNNEFRYARACLFENEEDYTLQIMADYAAPNGIADDRLVSFLDTFIYLMNELYTRSTQKEAIPTSIKEIHLNHRKAVELMHSEIPDFEQAIELYQKNSNFGFAGSLNNLGDIYENGIALRKNDLAAIYYYTRAAERGEPTAYLSLATLLSIGQPDKNILIESAKYAFLAISGLPPGYNKGTAIKCLEELKERLDMDDLEKAKQLASKWQPLFQETYLMKDTPAFDNIPKSEERVVH
jgi:Putative bacterial sensory transduction regulator/Sel1 repeat